jgi:hypothetical protein
MEILEQRATEHGLKVLASERAAADPTPGPLAQVFQNGDIQVGDFMVRKLYPVDLAIFKILDSPIHKMMLEAQKPTEIQDAVETTNEDEWCLVLQFTMPAIEAYKLAKRGKQAFEDEAVQRVGVDMPLVKPAQIIAAIIEQIGRAFKTRVNYEAEQEASNGDAVPFHQTASQR